MRAYALNVKREAENGSYLTESQAAAFLAEIGLTLSPATLCTMRTHGIGPRFVHLGRGHVFYTRQSLFDFVRNRIAWEDSRPATKGAIRRYVQRDVFEQAWQEHTRAVRKEKRARMCEQPVAAMGAT